MQGLIEKSHQDGEVLHGFVSDIRKAFESLPRYPIFEIALHLGLPQPPLELWKHFLDNTERRFLVQGEVSPPLSSNHGFPEGCSLSCVAMSIAGLTLHSYMNEFSRRSNTISYVDNLEVLARTLGSLQQGIITMHTWSELWNLDLDADKSYIWSTEAKTRREAAELGWAVEEKAKDLGAQMNYGKKGHIGTQTTRIYALEGIWPKLKRSLASAWKKQQLLRQAIWPRAFYGIATCTLGWSHIKQLRTEAMKALGFKMAGASPGIRLSLLCHEQCDPGFYQTWAVLCTFRRIAYKRPLFVQLWLNYMDHYDGTSKQGPFAKLLEVCSQLRWTIQAPLILDHHGMAIDWLQVQEKILYDLTKDAWSWKTFREVQHRKDFAGLVGLVWRVLQQALRAAPPHHRAALTRLHDGTFLEPSQHAKYDLGKSLQCPLCGGEDSLTHRCTACPARYEIYARHADIVHRWEEMTPAKKLHLLPSQNPHWVTFKKLAGANNDSVVRTYGKGESSECHLFTDGSCHGTPFLLYQLSAWAVVNASTDQCVVRGVLGGLGQGNDRAELCAIIAAVEYALTMRTDATIWTDSTYAAEGTSRLLQDIEDIPEGQHQDDWLHLQGLLCQREKIIRVQHVPGHARWDLCDQDLDSWLARWNDRADREANMAMKLHPADLRHQHHLLLGHHDRELADLKQLQALHIAISDAEGRLEELEVPDLGLEGDEDAEDWLVERGCPNSLSRIGALHHDLDLATLETHFGQTFVRHMVDVLRGWHNTVDHILIKFSFLELAIYLAEQCSAWTPMPHPSRAGHWCDRNAVNFSEPTIAALIRLGKTFLKGLDRCCTLNLDWCKGINLSNFGVFPPQDGLTLAVPRETARKLCATLLRFTRRRPIRRANDLSRPLRHA